ncbi:MAG: DUF4345 family protein [Burkholderiales bacterium]|nr:DUF4345 family protein [Burkholderiales bacterium]
MPALPTLLKCLAPLCLAAGASHGLLGLGADALLGARVPAEVMADPVLDSQNRFYGVSFMLNGVLLWLVATDVGRYRPVLYCLLAVMFAGGLARCLSIALQGLPAAPVLALLVVELVAPWLLARWATRVPGG